MTIQAMPIDIESSWEIDGGDRLDYWAKGHVDRGAFILALQENEDTTTTLENVKHRYLRQVPYLDVGDRSFLFQFLDAPARGAQKVTWVDVGDTEEWFPPIDDDGDAS